MSTAAPDYATRVLAWFDVNGRHDLPWQHPRTPYRVWLSEIMLQQTQVRVVIPYFERFVAALPDVRALAAAPLDEVLALWSGLGYYARARNLHAAAQRCVALHGGDLPRDFDALLALPGIGRSTAGAILSQAWGDRFAILDGNVKRVLARHHGIAGWPGLPKVEKALWAIADTLLPGTRMADYTQAQMDFGATLCTRFDPACLLCPVNDDCIAFAEGRVGELPSPKPSKALPEREATVLMLEDRAGRVLLVRRPPTGIWAALWSLPQADTHDAALDWLRAHAPGLVDDVDLDTPRRCAPIQHGFTHFRLQLHPLHWRGLAPRLRVRDNDAPEAAGDSLPDTGHAMRWVARGELASLGIPAPIRTLLQSRADPQDP
ncbi:A/G-specific adenine glycosylase [Luteimonas sp. BDR2-5]|uniref:A/G-specific adenine glycosylase n=1 Tax=Proluteimonas luteida TaxID=2878685 RepID=UPI001E395B7F|nr:A/G-specific adenine glycosylase [Luteimonas sp. BDR2-5]MCD9029414.1 A/G-specific adenine glycosylase [Luteimonas sp. BDR2-5]